MSKAVTFLLTILVVSQLLTLYWVVEVRDDFTNYRKLEEASKKNQGLLITALQRKIFRIENRLNIPSSAPVPEMPTDTLDEPAVESPPGGAEAEVPVEEGPPE